MRRIEFNEITKSAVTGAIKHPRQIDLNRVNAQQARRVLDRLVAVSYTHLDVYKRQVQLGGIFTFGHLMHERYIILAVGIAFLAALYADNRRLLYSATALGIAGFLNVYIVLKFGTDQLYDFIVLPLSLLEVGAFLWFAAEAARYIWTGKRIPIAPVQEAFSPLPQRKEEDAARRLEEAPDPARRMKKRDYIVMLAITAVYAVFALTNLGSMVIPERVSALPVEECEIFLTLEEQDYIETLKYYAGYGQGNMRVYTCLLYTSRCV